MTCPSCLIALAGFGDAAAAQAPTQTLPTEVGAEVLGSLAYVVGGPVVGSIALAILGAVAWKDHRVAGGALGLVGGGILGGLVGSYLAKRKIEAVLPALQDAVDAAADGSVPVTPDGSFVPPAGGWKIGPLTFPSGKIKTPELLAGNVSVRPLQLIGLLNLASPPPANSAGPLKLNIPVKQPPAATTKTWKVPAVKATSPVVPETASFQVPNIKIVPAATNVVKMPAMRTASSYAAPAASATAPNLVTPAKSAPSAQPIVAPALQISSTARQVVMPTAATATPTYGLTAGLSM